MKLNIMMYVVMKYTHINVEYVESIGYNARQASDYAVEYVSKLPFVSYITVISIERK